MRPGMGRGHRSKHEGKDLLSPGRRFILYGGEASLASSVLLETIVFIAVAMGLKRIPARLIDRIRDTRRVMGIAEQGQLAVRAPAGESESPLPPRGRARPIWSRALPRR